MRRADDAETRLAVNMDVLSTAAPRVVRARSLQEAADLVARFGDDARMVAGATALQLEWRRGARTPAHLIDLTALPELSGLSERPNGDLRIGAVTRLSELEHGIAERLPLLAETVRRVAAPGVRQLASIGGNIAGGGGCLIPTLLALAASVEMFDAGKVQVLPLRS
jgi:CO/xanthine dehydrogenase FAD-binding subunit